MQSVNYHHLRYFWTVAKQGSIASACKSLGLSQPAISTQLKTLEESLGEKLLERSGRGLVLTDAGQLVFRYAEEIFTTGSEMLDALRGRPTGRPARLLVGIADVLPKLIAHRLLEPALRLSPPVQIVCHEDKAERLLANLSLQSLDLVLADAPVTGQLHVRAYNHLLGESTVTFFATPKLARGLKRGFPHSLDGAPMLLPTENTTLRRALDPWFERTGLRPRVVGEFEDSALLKVFAEHGEGVCAAPSVIEREIRKVYGLVSIGETRDVTERFYAITVERRIRHPAVAAISNAAREHLFG